MSLLDDVDPNECAFFAEMQARLRDENAALEAEVAALAAEAARHPSLEEQTELLRAGLGLAVEGHSRQINYVTECARMRETLERMRRDIAELEATLREGTAAVSPAASRASAAAAGGAADASSDIAAEIGKEVSMHNLLAIKNGRGVLARAAAGRREGERELQDARKKYERRREAPLSPQPTVQLTQREIRERASLIMEMLQVYVQAC